MLKILLFLIFNYITLGDAQARTSLFPPWLEFTHCDYKNFQFKELPEDIIHIKNFPPDAYNRNICNPQHQIKPVPSTQIASQDPSKYFERSNKISFLNAQYDLFSWLSFITLNREINNKFDITEHNLRSEGSPCLVELERC